jgi:RNA polymerase sigma-70 factor (ECF subfamily)
MPDDLTELEALFREHAPRLRAWLERRIPTTLARRLDADDVMQEAFDLARGKYAAFKAQTALPAYPWLYGVVRDCYHRQWERHTRDCRNHLQETPWPDHSSLQLGLGLVAAGSTPSESLAHEEVKQRVLLAVQALSAGDRELLDMRYWEGFSFAEIAALLSIAEDAARMRHARALKRFAALWRGLGAGAGGEP